MELTIAQLEKLPEATQEVLRLAACIGNNFDLRTLATVSQQPKQAVFPELMAALQTGLILPISELDTELFIQDYKFLHDRVQQAAYQLIGEEDKPVLHLQIGRLLLQNTTPDSLGEQLFEIADHFNLGSALIADRAEGDRIAKLNLLAAQRAKTATAYRAAMEYFQAGLQLLAPDCWQTTYDLSLALYEAAAETAYLNNDFQQMEDWAGVVLQQAKTLMEKVKVYQVKIAAVVAQGDLKEAVQLGLQVLALLGLVIPEAPSPSDVQNKLAETTARLNQQGIETLIDLPELTDPRPLAAMDVITNIASAAFIVAPATCVMIVAAMVNLSISAGNGPRSAFAYCAYGVLLRTNINDIESGYQLGKLALMLVERLNATQLKANILQTFGSHLMHWKEHLRERTQVLIAGYHAGVETGDFEYASYCATYVCECLYLSGHGLEDLEQQIDLYSKAVRQIGQEGPLSWIAIFWQAVLNLLGQGTDPSRLIGDVYNEAEALPLAIQSNNRIELLFLYANRLILGYLLGEMPQVLENARQAKACMEGMVGIAIVSTIYFYESLACLELATKALAAERATLLEQVEANQKTMTNWATHAPMNFLHKVQLVEAERHRVLGNDRAAMDDYDRAIAGAKEHGYLQEEALAYELAAKFYLGLGKDLIARTYFQEAYYAYSHWGAIVKIQLLEKQYPQFLGSSPTRQTATSSTSSNSITNSSTGQSVAALDFASFIKASQAISREIVLSQLLTQLIKVMVENAGAQSGYLILETEGELLIEAEAMADGEITVLQSMPLEFVKPDASLPLLSSAVVNYAARTRESVVLTDAQHEGNFTSQPYIQNFQVKSVLSVPLVTQGQLRGVVYLENNLTTGAFTQERVEIVQLLSGQAAIAISNAKLYSQLQESERQIKQLYDASKRFVPEQFLSFLEKKSIVDVELGDRVEREMTVLFSDIRDFTTISEGLTPRQNFAFINEYLGYMEPQIQKYGGFIDKYIGDAIMALFPNSADDALKAAIAMLQELKTYNSYRQQRNLNPLQIGIGLHTGKLILGTVGGFGRMDGTVIGDAVNLSSRVEGLTKTYGVSLLITHQTLARLNNPWEYDLRFIEQVRAKGKAKAVGLFEVFSADPPELRSAKNATKGKFERAVMLYYGKLFPEAGRLFQECLEAHEGDRAARSYLERCDLHLS